MLDNLFSTFIVVGQKLSFSKAAEELYLTPNAVKKRIESLEEQLGIKLFIRSNRGVTLTKGGASLFNDLSAIYEDFSLAVEKAIGLEKDEEMPLHIGIMSTFSEMFLSAKWFDKPAENKKPSHLIKYGNSINDLDSMLNSLGKDLDFVIDLYQPALAKRYGLNVKKISDYNIYLGTNCLDELNCDMTVECLYPGRSDVIDNLITELLKFYPGMKIEYVNDCNLWTLQKAMEKRHSIIVFENQKHLFPYLKFIQLPIKRKISFGIYFKEKSELVDNFIDYVMKRTV
ncbi:MAG: LysR family transcriptional regulator [Erysipelotrichaceae bacterium]|nr:LysR family transcriptional regulator [Erysipelotrichaceae bacterium]